MNQNQLREYLFQQDLAHEKQMDKLIKDAQPKKLNEDYKINLIKAPIITKDLIGPEYIAERQLLDLSLDLQMQNTIKQANYAVNGKTPEAMKSSVTEEMIADYKKEVMKPVEIGGKYRLYRPVEIPPLVRPTQIPYNHGGPKITEVAYKRRRQDILDDIEYYRLDLERAQTYRKTLEDRFRITSSSTPTTFDETARTAELMAKTRADLEAIITAKSLPFPKPRNKPNLTQTIIDSEKTGTTDLSSIKTELGILDADIQQLIRQINGANAAFAALKASYEQQEDADEENRINLLEYEKKKRNLPHDALSEFNRLNQGKIQVARQQNETDDEFLARLQQMGNIFVDPNDMQKQIETEILNKAKKNILELTSDYGKAESVTRMLNNNERFQMNKVFPMIKKDYSEKFGINNKNLDDVEMAQFIKNKIETGQALITPKTEKTSTETQTNPTQEATPALVASNQTPPLPQGVIATRIRQFSKKQLETIIDELNADDPSLNLKKGKKSEMIMEIEDAKLYDAPKFRALLKMPNVETETFPIAPTSDPRSSLSAFNPEGWSPEQTEQFSGILDGILSTTGGGIKNHVLPSTVPFGKIALDLNKLFYQNVLSIKRHNGNKIIGHKNKRVSDNFVDIILKMFENKPITQSDLKNIKDEQMLYDNLIVQSGLHKLKKIPTNIEQTSEQMKNRLGLITGEIEAGNSNKALLTELHELLFKMVRVHLISKNAAAAYYKNIKDNFFTL
jgi:hypothetical protein